MPDVRPPHGTARGFLSLPPTMRLLALALVSLLAFAATGCGGGDDLTAESPRTSPDLTIPTTPDDAAAADADADEDATSTTDTDAADAAGDDPATGGTAADPSAGGTAAPAPEAAPAAPTAPETGGTAEPAAPEQAPAPEDTGGAGAGDLSDFCAENPGAC